MRAKKKFIVVAYDIENDRKRLKIAKLLGRYGVCVNKSVFECMLTDMQFEKLRNDIALKINHREDQIIYYPICLACYEHIVYQPEQKFRYEKINIV